MKGCTESESEKRENGKKGLSRGERENNEERIAGRDWRNNGNEREIKMDLLINDEGNGYGGYILDLLSVKNIRREGEVDGNTIYWEYKKG